MDNKQKADIGQRYIAALKERIATRTVAQKRAALKAKGIDESDSDSLATALRPLALKLLRTHRLPGDLESFHRSNDYVQGKRQTTLVIETTGGAKLTICTAGLIAIEAALKATEAAKALAGELCQEISFLHGLLQPARVAEFQAYACRLWAPSSKGDRIGAALVSLVEDFITAKRPALCKVA